MNCDIHEGIKFWKIEPLYQAKMKFPIYLPKEDSGRKVFTKSFNSRINLEIQVQYSLKSSHVTINLYTNTLTHGRTLINHLWSVEAKGQIQKRTSTYGFTCGHDMSIDLDLSNSTCDGDKVTLLIDFELLQEEEANSKFENLKKAVKLRAKKRFDQVLATKAYILLSKPKDTTKLLECIKKSKAGILNKKEITKVKRLEREKDGKQSLSQLLFYLSRKKNWFQRLINILHKHCPDKEIYQLLGLIQLHYGDFKRGWKISDILTTVKGVLDTHRRLTFNLLEHITPVAVVLSVAALLLAGQLLYANKEPLQDMLSIQTIKMKTTSSSLPTSLMATSAAHKTLQTRHDELGSNPNKYSISKVAVFFENMYNAHEMAANIDANDNSLVILTTGLYYVYTYVGVRLIKGNNSPEITCTTLFYYLYRVSAKIDMMTSVLARSVQTICSEIGHAEKPSYTGGVFKLYSGDKIQVHLHGQDQFEMIPQSSFVGLFMVKSEM